MPHWAKRQLKLTDMQSLVSAHEAVGAVITALRTTNWAGAGTAIAALVPVDLWIVDLYNRFEPAWLSYIGRNAQDADPDAAQDGAADSQGDQGGPANGSEPRS